MRGIVTLGIYPIVAAVVTGPANDITAIGKGDNIRGVLTTNGSGGYVIFAAGKGTIVVNCPGNNIKVIATNLTVRRPGNDIATVIAVY